MNGVSVGLSLSLQPLGIKKAAHKKSYCIQMILLTA